MMLELLAAHTAAQTVRDLHRHVPPCALNRGGSEVRHRLGHLVLRFLWQAA